MIVMMKKFQAALDSFDNESFDFDTDAELMLVQQFVVVAAYLYTYLINKPFSFFFFLFILHNIMDSYEGSLNHFLATLLSISQLGIF